ncbi:MAG TPA: hypothetical protein VLA33_06395 [Gemmatimonadota bacterium]|nr:hypothetical protein [Gemmatimonadota bacterium]
MSRGGVAWLVVAAWILALGWNARREHFRPEAERLALGAAMLPPGAAYYALDVGARGAGMVSVEIDTLPGRAGFTILEQHTVRLPGLGEAGETEIRTETWLGPRVTLDSLRRRTVRGGDTLHTRARIVGDSLHWEGGEGTAIRPLPAAGAVQTAVSWPLRYVAAGGAEAGDVRRLTLLDPATGDLREVDLRTLETGTRVFADSADTDPDTDEWIVAGRDTVQAWRVERIDAASGTEAAPRLGAVRREAWIDEDGRVIEAELAGGLRMRRTAFELAFFADERGERGEAPESAEPTDQPPPEDR